MAILDQDGRLPRRAVVAGGLALVLGPGVAAAAPEFRKDRGLLYLYRVPAALLGERGHMFDVDNVRMGELRDGHFMQVLLVPGSRLLTMRAPWYAGFPKMELTLDFVGGQVHCVRACTEHLDNGLRKQISFQPVSRERALAESRGYAEGAPNPGWVDPKAPPAG